MLTVADAQGNSGGQAGTIFTVSGELCRIFTNDRSAYAYTDASNNDDSCMKSTSPSANMTLWANVSTSDDLSGCQPLGLRITGGQKPYTISIAGSAGSSVTNVTLGENDDVYTWPNTVKSGSQIIGKLLSLGFIAS